MTLLSTNQNQMGETTHAQFIVVAQLNFIMTKAPHIPSVYQSDLCIF
jgi:hypothetical protein